MLNIFFVFLIVLSIVAYFFYKTKQYRSTLPIQRKWYTAKAGVALGIFILSFGLNTSIIYPTLVGYFITAVFFVLGLMLAYSNYKRARHEGKYVHEEYELNK